MNDSMNLKTTSKLLFFILLPGLSLLAFMPTALQHLRDYQISSVKSISSSPSGSVCILYDRPPRTGSTTISRTLERCLLRRGYEVLPAKSPNGTRETVLHRLRTSTARRRASVMQHVYTNAEDMRALQKGCGKLFYMTSTAPMLSRLVSMIKYTTFQGHRNATVDANNLAYEMQRRQSNLHKREALLEAYPYVGEHVPEDMRVKPHYVVRQEAVEEDLSRLLNMWGCGDLPIESLNVHDLDFEERGAKETKQISSVLGDQRRFVTMGDGRYRTLTGLAEGFNKPGLQLARFF